LRDIYFHCELVLLSAEEAGALRLLLISAECELIIIHSGKNPGRATWKFKRVVKKKKKKEVGKTAVNVATFKLKVKK